MLTVTLRARAHEDSLDDEADDWDTHFCNHIDHRGRQCTARIDPALGRRYCWQHKRPTAAPTATTTAPTTVPVGAAAFTLGGVRYGPPKREDPPLDLEVATGIARSHMADVIGAKLGRFLHRWDGGERTDDLARLLAEWRQIAAARATLDAAVR